MSNVSFFGSALFLELCLASGQFDDCLITYSANNPRKDCIKATRGRISAFAQLKGCLWVMMGPTVIVSMLVNTFLMNFLNPVTPANEKLPPLQYCILQIALLLICNDFLLYWGHRIQHMNEFLWKNCHWYHHQLDTPTPVSTIYIDKTDATLQGGLPMIIASALLRPHPFVVYAFMAVRVADNAINHSGMDSKLLNFLFLKYLPFRGAVGHHDSHHKYSNYTTNAKNFGEYFYLWDVMFGYVATISDQF